MSVPRKDLQVVRGTTPRLRGDFTLSGAAAALTNTASLTFSLWYPFNGPTAGTPVLTKAWTLAGGAAGLTITDVPGGKYTIDFLVGDFLTLVAATERQKEFAYTIDHVDVSTPANITRIADGKLTVLNAV